MTDRVVMNNLRPLANLRVLDFSWVWSGPLVTAILAEFGAEVIKVEHGERLDSARLRGRPMQGGKPMQGPSIEIGPYFHQTNHDKRSITVNLKSPAARALLDRLAGISDIVVENLSPGALTRVGLGYERLAAINPRLIYLSMAAAGQSGPMSAMRAYAPIMSSYCGFEGLIGYPGEAPIGMMNFGYGDPNAAVHALLPLLAAIHEAEDSGLGQHIDMSQIEALMCVVAEPLIDRFMNGRDAVPTGNRHPRMAPHGIFPAAGDDRWVSIAVADDEQWQRLIDLMARPAWACDAGLAQAPQRVRAAALIETGLARWTGTRTQTIWRQACAAPASPARRCRTSPRSGPIRISPPARSANPRHIRSAGRKCSTAHRGTWSAAVPRYAPAHPSWGRTTTMCLNPCSVWTQTRWHG